MSENRRTKAKNAFKRRDILKVMTAVPAAALASLEPATPAEPPRLAPAAATPTVAGYRRKILNQHEWETIKALSDLIIPADGRSGSATQAGVPEFIDDWLDFRKGDLLTEIRGGLTWLDLECNRLFSNDFVKSSREQQVQILDRIAYPHKATLADASYVAFFNQLRDLVVGGFFSSEIGVKDLPYLGNTFVPRWGGCPSVVLSEIEANINKRGVGLKLSAAQKTSKG